MSGPRSILRQSRACARRWARGLALAAPLALGACANLSSGLMPAGRAPVDLFDDARFAPPAEPIDPAHVFDLSPAMRAYLEHQIVPAARSMGVREALTDQLYNRSRLQLEYEATMTRNAAEAFDARTGNCLSLVIMTGAFAKALGVPVTYQQVTIDEMWSRAGDMYFMSGHVNLQMERRQTEMMSRYDRNGLFTVDFLPVSESVGFHTRAIGEDTILAMYMNNRAAEAMVQGRLDDAYWRARQAIALDPTFLSPYNTLGVIYLRHGDAAQAEQVLRYVADRVPDNPRVLANRVEALRKLGRAAEADAVQARLATLEPYPPFYFFNRGQAALAAGDLASARSWFRKELDRSPDYHEFHYWLAVADFGLGRIDEARSELAIALRDAVQRTDRDLYAVKLDKLKAYRQATDVQ